MQFTTPSTVPNRSSAFLKQASIVLESAAMAMLVSHRNSLCNSSAACSFRTVRSRFVPALRRRFAVALAMSEVPPKITIVCEVVIWCS